MNLQKDGALQTNAVRHADAMDICFFLIRFNASHIVFLEICPSEEVFEGNK
jgi:hypothetical protein